MGDTGRRGRLEGKNAIITGAAGYVSSCFVFAFSSFLAYSSLKHNEWPCRLYQCPFNLWLALLGMGNVDFSLDAFYILTAALRSKNLCVSIYLDG